MTKFFGAKTLKMCILQSVLAKLYFATILFYFGIEFVKENQFYQTEVLTFTLFQGTPRGLPTVSTRHADRTYSPRHRSSPSIARDA